MPARVNLLTNPSFETGVTGWTANSATLSNPVTGGLVGVRHARLTSTVTGAAFSLVASATVPVTAGQPYSESAYVRGTVGRSVQMRATWTGATATLGSAAAVASTTDYQRITLAGVVPVGATAVRFDVLVGAAGVVVGTILDVDACLLEAAPLGDYFDGATADTPTTRFDWTGAANASTSTATPWVDVSLVPSGTPNPVQIVLTGIPNGVAYEVTGTTGDGSSWPVPGGAGVSTGAQVVLVDNRSALNSPVTYTATWGGATYTSAPIAVPYAGRAVLQSLDGQTTIPFVWRDNGDPREYVVRSVAFDIPNRARPAIRYATGGDGGGTLQIRTARTASAELVNALRTGRPLVLRTDGAIRDIPAVEIILIRAASNRSWGAITAPGVVSADRVWDLPYILVDDPEPGTALAAWSWDDFDAAMATRTWADHDALFAGSTWDAWDTYPWGQL